VEQRDGGFLGLPDPSPLPPLPGQTTGARGLAHTDLMKARRRLWWLIVAVCVVAAAVTFAATRRATDHGEFDFLYRFSPVERLDRVDITHAGTSGMEHSLAFAPNQADDVLREMRDRWTAKTGWVAGQIQPGYWAFDKPNQYAVYMSERNYLHFVMWPDRTKLFRLEGGACVVQWCDFHPAGWFENAWNRVRDLFGR
jgi:hypothetical protein